MSRPVYIGVFLDEASRQALLEAFPAVHPNVHAHHMTMIFRPSERELGLLLPGQRARLVVTGHAQNDRVQAVRVLSLMHSTNPSPHITISVADGAKPVESNELLDKGMTLVDAFIILEGVIDVFPRTKEQ